MKKSYQIILNDRSKIIIDAIGKTTNETVVKVHELFEEENAALLLSITHEELNTLLDLTKVSSYMLLYFYDGYFFAAAAYSGSHTKGSFLINTQYKHILFVPPSIKFNPGEIFTYTPMAIVERKATESKFQHRAFLNGYGKFPYLILKAGYAMFIQIPVHFNANGDYVNYPGTSIDDVSEAELAEYRKNKTGELHDRLIARCQWIKTKIETDYQKPCTLCLVEGPETGYYFDKDDIKFSTNIPRGGTLLTQENKILAMNVEHYIN